MLPGDRLSTEPDPKPFLEPIASRMKPLEDTERGGVGLSDPSLGLQVKTWHAYYNEPDVVVEAEGVEPTVLFSRPGLTHLSLAFDQNMRPCVAFVQAGEAWLWWYDSQASGQVFTQLAGNVVTPRVTTDEKRPNQLGVSDIILAYLRDGGLYYRQQRDRFGTERLLAMTDASQLLEVGMNVGLRLQFRLLP